MRLVVHYPMYPIRRALEWSFWILLVIGAGALGYAVFTVAEGVLYQRANTLLLNVSPPAPLGSDRQPDLRAAALEGAAISRLEIPRLGMSVVVAEGTTPHTLKLGAGHIRGTAFPDEVGNIGIAGHRDTFFRPLRGINAGDTVVLTTPHQVLRYSVEWARVVQPSSVDVLRPSPEPLLTLVTCYPFKFVGSAPDRFIVR
ncbi:MAG TPA: class D sortase, partial [Bryobacteraceae bacterium]